MTKDGKCHLCKGELRTMADGNFICDRCHVVYGPEVVDQLDD